MKSKRNSVLTGVTGEYYVAAELSRMGYIASITLRNTRGIDIVCSNGNATKTVSIQVKTRSSERHTWVLSDKSEEFHSPKHFYVFVNLADKKDPEYSIVPSKVVAKYIKANHERYLSTVSKNGNKHKDSSMRKFRDLEKKYHNKWNLLGLN